MILDETELCLGEAHYEERIVAFFDVLGWRDEIDAAGNDPKRIARLAAAVQLFASNVGTVNEEGVFLTTFSDNVVVSKPFAPTDVPWLLQGLATTQLGLAAFGFWMRGGVTVGKLIHDEHIVFGPALNRAYHLENKIAKFPRILLDDCLSAHLPPGTDFLEIGNPSFIDAFRPEFWDRIQAQVPIQAPVLAKFQEIASLPVPMTPVLFPGHLALSNIAARLSAELTTTQKPDVWDKLSWLFDRVVQRLGGATKATDLPRSQALILALEEAGTVA